MGRQRRQIGFGLLENSRFVSICLFFWLLIPAADDRFIAKELSRPELQTMETFAPAYFDYMSSAVSADVRPLVVF
jgi:hypothetical protein